MPLLVFGNDHAVLVRAGEIVNAMRPGTYVLTGAMLGPGASPGPAGSPLDVEVVFVSTQANGGWPVSGPVPVIDPHAQLRGYVRFAGTFGVRCTDPKRLVASLAGAVGPLEVRLAEILREPVMRALQTAIAECTLGNARSILGLRESAGAQAALEAALVPGRQGLAAFGLGFLGFDGGSFGFAPEDEAALHRLVAPLPASTPAGGVPSLAAISSVPSSPAIPAAPTAPPPSPQPRPFSQTPYPILKDANAAPPPQIMSVTPVPQRPAFAITPVPVSREAAPSWSDGARVLALWSDGRWYPGSVRARSGDRYEIAFENSTATRWVGPGEIQSI